MISNTHYIARAGFDTPLFFAPQGALAHGLSLYFRPMAGEQVALGQATAQLKALLPEPVSFVFLDRRKMYLLNLGFITAVRTKKLIN